MLLIHEKTGEVIEGSDERGAVIKINGDPRDYKVIPPRREAAHRKYRIRWEGPRLAISRVPTFKGMHPLPIFDVPEFDFRPFDEFRARPFDQERDL
jgi:hypothetical protein